MQKLNDLTQLNSHLKSLIKEIEGDPSHCNLTFEQFKKDLQTKYPDIDHDYWAARMTIFTYGNPGDARLNITGENEPELISLQIIPEYGS